MHCAYRTGRLRPRIVSTRASKSGQRIFCRTLPPPAGYYWAERSFPPEQPRSATPLCIAKLTNQICPQCGIEDEQFYFCQIDHRRPHSGSLSFSRIVRSTPTEMRCVRRFAADRYFSRNARLNEANSGPVKYCSALRCEVATMTVAGMPANSLTFCSASSSASSMRILAR